MENMGLLLKETIELADLQRLLDEHGYRTTLFNTGVNEQLNVHQPDAEKVYWFVHKFDKTGLLYDDESEYEDVDALGLKCFFVFLYHVDTLPYLVTPLRIILSKYEGFASCHATLRNAFRLDTIADIVSGCP